MGWAFAAYPALAPAIFAGQSPTQGELTTGPQFRSFYAHREQSAASFSRQFSRYLDVIMVFAKMLSVRNALALVALSSGLAVVSTLPASAVDVAYPASQARQGTPLYRDNCSSCHGDRLQGALDAPPLKGDSFMASWAGQPATALLEYISTNMPQDRPGALEPKQYAQLLALILKENGVAAGADDTPPIAADTLGDATIPAAK